MAALRAFWPDFFVHLSEPESDVSEAREVEAPCSASSATEMKRGAADRQALLPTAGGTLSPASEFASLTWGGGHAELHLIQVELPPYGRQVSRRSCPSLLPALVGRQTPLTATRQFWRLSENRPAEGGDHFLPFPSPFSAPVEKRRQGGVPTTRRMEPPRSAACAWRRWFVRRSPGAGRLDHLSRLRAVK